MNCTACTAPTATGITLCAACLNRLADVLDGIPDALEMAEDTVAKQGRTGSGGSGSGGVAESQAPINLTASERRTALWERVVSWARMVLEHDDSDDLRGVEPVVYLQMSTELVQHQDFAGELLDELETHYLKVMRVVDTAPDIVALGQCGAVHEGVPCPGALSARVIHHDSDNKTRTIEPFSRCRVCGVTHDAVQIQQERAAEAWDHYAPLTDVVQALRVSGFSINPKSAQRWASQGELPVLRYREDGVALYSPGQVISAHQRMKTKRGRPRKVA